MIAYRLVGFDTANDRVVRDVRIAEPLFVALTAPLARPSVDPFAFGMVRVASDDIADHAWALAISERDLASCDWFAEAVEDEWSDSGRRGRGASAEDDELRGRTSSTGTARLES